MNRKLFLLASLFIVSLLILAGNVMAGPPPPPPPPCPTPPCAVPIDGFSALLLASGISYGVTKLRGRFKK